jgi:hypothetical protein
MTKRQIAKLDALRRDLICLSWQYRVARKNKERDVETEASLEREITLCQIENVKQGNSR